MTFAPSTNCDRTTDSAYSKHTIIMFIQTAPISYATIKLTIKPAV
jgi:hypothetical protein